MLLWKQWKTIFSWWRTWRSGDGSGLKLNQEKPKKSNFQTLLFFLSNRNVCFDQRIFTRKLFNFNKVDFFVKSVDAYFVVYHHIVYDHDYDRETHDCDHDTHVHDDAAEEHCGHHDHNYGVDGLLGNCDIDLDEIYHNPGDDHFDTGDDHDYLDGSKGLDDGLGNFEVAEILEVVDSTAAVENTAVDIELVVDLVDGDLAWNLSDAENFRNEN